MDRKRLVLWNSNGILGKLGEFIHFLHTHDIAIAMLCETKLKGGDKVSVKNYKTIRKDGPNGHGGVAMFVRNDVQFQPTRVTGPLESLDLVMIRLSDNTHIVTIYNSPQNTLIKQTLDTLFKFSRKMIIAGDFNARHTSWGNHSNNRNGINLYNFSMQNNILVSYPNTYTHIPFNGSTPSTIDLLLIKNTLNVGEPEVINDLSSDHLPVLSSIGGIETASEAKNHLDYAKGNWAEFRKFLNKFQIVSDIDDITKLDNVIYETTNNIIDAARLAIPRKKTSTSRDNLPEEILAKMKERNKFRKMYQNSRSDHFRESMKQLNAEIKLALIKFRNEKWSKFLKNLKPQDGSLWRVSKHFKKQNNNIDTLLHNNQFLTADSEKAECLAETLTQQHSLPNTDNNTETLVTNTVNAYLNNNTPHPAHAETLLTTPHEIKRLIKHLPSKKAPGPDTIQNILLKYIPRKTLVQITHIINAIFKLQYFPNTWKIATVIPIHKHNKPKHSPTSYRPISLLNTLSKLTEKIIAKHINTHTTQHNILPNEQFGFRPGHNSLHQVARVIEDATDKLNKKQHTALVAMDVEKAFDRVWHEGLVYKMILLKFDTAIIKLVHNFLSNRHFRVKINNTLSNKRPQPAGVPQGCVLSPILYNIYTYDIPFYPNNSNAIFADDTAFYTASFSPILAVKKIQNQIPSFTNYTRKWKITTNTEKTQLIILSKRNNVLNIPTPLKINSHQILHSTTIKYLGITLDQRLTFIPHIATNIRNTSGILKLLYPLLSKSSLSTTNKKLLYTAIIRPVLLYGSPLLLNISATQLNKLQVFQNKCLRMILGRDTYTKIETLHEEADIPRVEDRISATATKFFEASTASDNPLIKQLTKRRRANTATNKHAYPHQNLAIFDRDPPPIN